MSWTIIWQTWVFIIGIFFVLPLIGSALISVVTTRTNQHLMRAFGLNAPLIFGWFGVMIHEISHAVMSIIFGHHVDKIKLLQNPFKEGNENRMGYVSHAWNPKNKYQQLGNFFIGMAPIFGITLTSLGLTKLLWPQLLIGFHDGSSVWLNTAWWQVALWIYAILNLSLALNLSDADWQNTKSGALYYFIFLTIVALGVGLWINDAFIIWETVGRPIAYFFGGVLAATFIMYMLTAIIGRR